MWKNVKEKESDRSNTPGIFIKLRKQQTMIEDRVSKTQLMIMYIGHTLDLK